MFDKIYKILLVSLFTLSIFFGFINDSYASDTVFLKGYLGKDLGINMEIERDGDKLIGFYEYEKYKADIKISGFVNIDDSIILFEYNKQGRNTGKFVGTWNNGRMSGKWYNPTGTKNYDFNLSEYTKYVPKTYTKEYTGIVAGEPVHMSLEQIEQKLSGKYYYDKNKDSQEKLLVNGTIDKSGSFILFESDANGTSTGKFIGILLENQAKGTWYNPDGSKNFPFILKTMF